MSNRARDWLDQAWRDWEHTRHDAAEGYHEWACFSAQQAAEKALKALYQHLGAKHGGFPSSDSWKNCPQKWEFPQS